MLSNRIPRKQLSPFHHFSIFAFLNAIIPTRNLMRSNSPASSRVYKVLSIKNWEVWSMEGIFSLYFCILPWPSLVFLYLYQKYFCKGLYLCQFGKISLIKSLERWWRWCRETHGERNQNSVKIRAPKNPHPVIYRDLLGKGTDTSTWLEIFPNEKKSAGRKSRQTPRSDEGVKKRGKPPESRVRISQRCWLTMRVSLGRSRWKTALGCSRAPGSTAPGVPGLCSSKCLCREQRKRVKIELST